MDFSRVLTELSKLMDAKTVSEKAARDRVQELEGVLQTIQDGLFQIGAKGHKSGYDWNADPNNLTLIESEIFALITDSLNR